MHVGDSKTALAYARRGIRHYFRMQRTAASADPLRAATAQKTPWTFYSTW